VRYFHTRFSEFGCLRYAHVGAYPGLPHMVCFPAHMPYMTSHTAHHFRLRWGALKAPICTSALTYPPLVLPRLPPVTMAKRWRWLTSFHVGVIERYEGFRCPCTPFTLVCAAPASEQQTRRSLLHNIPPCTYVGCVVCSVTRWAA
jgi:hypothetical protein